MQDEQCRPVKKLSARLPEASLAEAGRELARLRRLTAESAEIGEELSQVVAELRQVAAPPDEPFIFTPVLAENERLLRAIFRDCDDIKYRAFKAGQRQALLVYLNWMTDLTLLEKNVLETLMTPGQGGQVSVDPGALVNQFLTSASLTVTYQASEAIEAVMTGNALLLVDGIAEAFTIGTVKHVKRTVEGAKSEGVVRGPQDAFNETLSDNIVLIRRRTRDPNVKIRVLKLGERTKTAIALVYVANLVKPGLVEEVERRLNLIKVDSVILSTTVEEALSDHPWTPFPQAQVTERPETMVAAVYEGRVGIIVDNTPFSLIVPCTYANLLQSTDDYTARPTVASLIRLTRHASAFLAIYLPALYIAIVSFHPGMLPTTLAISIAELRARTPFPSLLEAVMMEILLEIFQEAIIRLPNKFAGAAGVVGGLVIGTTVVQAALVNPLLVVVIATTAIASYTMPSYHFSMALRSLRVPLLILASVLGLYGVMLGVLAITTHMCSLRSFGESYLGGTLDITLLEDWKDMLVRFPVKFLRARPKELGPQERTRMGGGHG
ncbi:spore germination protein [Sporolituus thermophilus DSM 23256]|uniref:Spore germination protein n=1 Tax=Sporolituus thermophilus DSM 23256 TaxID=1123285 RepID=A0A1G7IVX8_9FIRM|nr:spore germination protein [Sporolituus thermophilus DSM 23256]